MSDIFTRIVSAAGPDRKIDMALYPGYIGTMGRWPTYTKYIENAAKLVPTGMRFAVFDNGGGKGPYAVIMRDSEPVISECYAATIALALCGAAVKAQAKA